MITLDATTLSSYLAAATADARAQAVIDSLSGTVYVRVYNGAGTLMGEGTMAGPWATRSGSAITVGEVSSFTVLQSGTPNAASWYLRFETAGGRWVRGPFGPGGNFTWSLGSTWNAGQSGSLGTVTLNAKGTIALAGAAIAAGAGAAGLTVSGGGSGTFTITGSGFGTRASLTPLFHRFFAPGDVTDGASISGYGYNTYAVGSPAGSFIDTSDGFVPGYGCIRHTTQLGAADSFPHIYPILSGLAERQIFQSYYFKPARIAGSGAATRQIKGPRYSYNAEYSGAPRLVSSLYPYDDFASYGYTHFGVFDPSNVENGTDDAGIGATYKDRWQNGWNCVESWADFGSVGAADGFIKTWINGAQIPRQVTWDSSFDSDAVQVRASSAHLINFVSLFPGYDFITTTNQFRLKFCEHVVDTTPARVVVGNAATWGACTHRQYMIPTAWSDGSVTASWRPLGFATSGQTVYGYVVNSSGAVSAATSLVVP